MASSTAGSRILHGCGLTGAVALTQRPLVCRGRVQERESTAPGDQVVYAGEMFVTSASGGGAADASGRGVPDTVIWETIAASRAWLDQHNGDAEPELGLRILKIVEEAGEAAAAWIGTLGQNPRKGVSHSRQDVADELGDVAFTALVAVASLGYDPQDILRRVADKVRPRLTGPPQTPVPTTRPPDRGSTRETTDG